MGHPVGVCMDNVIVDMLAGNQRHAAEFQSRFDDVQNAQHPDAVTVCCADSRVLQDELWANTDPGSIFTCANIGNRVIQQTPDGDVVSGDVLYPIEHTGTETAVVVGHTGCGAVTAAYRDLTGDTGAEPPGIAHSLTPIRTRLAAGVDLLPADLSESAAINRLVEYNVDQQVQFLLESDRVDDDVSVVGAVYDFQDVYPGSRGEAHVINVDGETDPSALREQAPEIASRITRLWSY